MTVVFTDGRFSNMTNVTSQLQNISCSNNLAATTLTDCDLLDQCQSRCVNPIGLRCFGNHYLTKCHSNVLFVIYRVNKLSRWRCTSC